jgi:hypothetical protein
MTKEKTLGRNTVQLKFKFEGNKNIDFKVVYESRMKRIVFMGMFRI